MAIILLEMLGIFKSGALIQNPRLDPRTLACYFGQKQRKLQVQLHLPSEAQCRWSQWRGGILVHSVPGSQPLPLGAVIVLRLRGLFWVLQGHGERRGLRAGGGAHSLHIPWANLVTCICYLWWRLVAVTAVCQGGWATGSTTTCQLVLPHIGRVPCGENWRGQPRSLSIVKGAMWFLTFTLEIYSLHSPLWPRLGSCKTAVPRTRTF